MRLRWTVEGREQFRLLAGEEVRIGRGTENEVVLPDFSVSRRHASMRRSAAGVWTIEDLETNFAILPNLSSRIGMPSECAISPAVCGVSPLTNRCTTS